MIHDRRRNALIDITDSKATSQAEDTKPSVTVTEPLAPPPKPSNPAETPDYFSGLHNPSAGISGEFNPFESSFGAPSSETPGKAQLPGIAALTSPAIPGTTTGGGYSWAQAGQSLRTGPLSPAMLQGPAGGDYFGYRGGGGLPTPNESSLRTGLTPGGSLSMFPAPSPGSSLYPFQSGSATPGTLDFHRTALNAAAQRKNTQTTSTSNPQESSNMDAQHDATDAANGLFMLAKGAQANGQYTQNSNSQQMQTRSSGRPAPGSGSVSANGDGESPDDTPTTRGRGKKGAVKAETPARRKSESTTKASNKRAKGNNGHVNVDPALAKEEDFDEDDDDDDMMGDDDMGGQTGGKSKMTDEEKRRNFLERNR
jgi:ATF/CREB family transcription factor